MRKRKPWNFQGAGLFLFYQDSKGRPYVLLGKRKYPPYKDFFSVSTGQSIHTADSEKLGRLVRHYMETPRNTALREAKEEIVLESNSTWPSADELLPLFSIKTWFYNWENFAYLLPGENVPKVAVGEPEVEAWEWFPLDQLPNPLFPGIFLLSPPLEKLIQKGTQLLNLKPTV